MTSQPFAKNRLFCPGPTPVPAEVAISALNTNIYHRTDSFREILLTCRKALTPFFKSEVDPIILTSSGTGALESAVVNLTNVKDRVLVLNGGKFGERWEKLTSAYQCEVVSHRIPWGTSPDINILQDVVKKSLPLKAIFFQANETSTGVAYPVDQIAKAVKEISPETLIVVDAVSGLIAHKMDMVNWEIDCVVSGSQKGFGIPPGLSFIALSPRAWNNLSQRPKFYFDLKKEKSGQDVGETAWTPATTLILSLQNALKELGRLGPEVCELHHKLLATACRAAVKALGLSLFPSSHPSQALTAVSLPSHLDGSLLVRHCRESYGAIFAGGQDQLKGKIVRISHLGMVDQLDLLSGLAAFEMTLSKLGHKHILGAGTGAAMAVLLESTL